MPFNLHTICVYNYALHFKLCNSWVHHTLQLVGVLLMNLVDISWTFSRIFDIIKVDSIRFFRPNAPIPWCEYMWFSNVRRFRKVRQQHWKLHWIMKHSWSLCERRMCRSNLFSVRKGGIAQFGQANIFVNFNATATSSNDFYTILMLRTRRYSSTHFDLKTGPKKLFSFRAPLYH